LRRPKGRGPKKKAEKVPGIKTGDIIGHARGRWGPKKGLLGKNGACGSSPLSKRGCKNGGRLLGSDIRMLRSGKKNGKKRVTWGGHPTTGDHGGRGCSTGGRRGENWRKTGKNRETRQLRSRDVGNSVTKLKRKKKMGVKGGRDRKKKKAGKTPSKDRLMWERPKAKKGRCHQNKFQPL